MRRPPAPYYDPWVLALVLIGLAGIAWVIVWASSLEQPYPCRGRGNCVRMVLQ